MKRKKKQSRIAALSDARGVGTNPRLHAQTRKQLRTHYAAKYRAHRPTH